MSCGPSSAAGEKRGGVVIVLPVYSEAANIGPLLDRIEEHLKGTSIAYRMIEVDDGSRDGSLAILEEYARRRPLNIYRHTVNLGLGASIRDGLA